MRWLTLYARSRQVPASLAALVIGAAAVWALSRDGGGGPGDGDPRLSVLVLALGVMAASIGLGGQDLALDRTAAIRWVPRRAAHVLLAGAVVAAVPLSVRALGSDMGATAAFVLRDSAGLTGLAALGAALSGGPNAWTLPFAWLSVSLFAPPATGTPTRVAAWLLLPSGTPEATWTALLLLISGTAAYAVAGPRR
ncbi:hypothetical protein JHN63_10055 [Streptomyces sp. MBT65]|uniref:hypothetical protein n=1 Tax=Streptomyces sp. MBT65 TaxID=1488395 RepID=UPI00190E1C76|nr:hypothetical protein [Streptomyces sp. MBT65]MBK3574160.1 hypothetical protein [Streptomyces sp. MBT65]